MADEDEKPGHAAIPTWQTAQSEPDASPPPPSVDSQDASSAPDDSERKGEDSTDNFKATEDKDTSDTDGESKEQEDEDDERLTVARRFLADPSVQSSPLASKLKFLRDKGLPESTIQSLLPTAATAPTTQGTADDASVSTSVSAPPPSTSSEASSSSSSSSSQSQPPIITYPEFLQSSNTNADKPPLVTSTALLATLQATTLVSALVYGTSQLYLQPLLGRLNDSRADFHASVTDNLSSIITKLESSVSELPPPPPTAGTAAGAAASQKQRDQDADSDADDPSELFHRDVGTQTTLQTTSLTTPAAAPVEEKSPSESQAGQLSTLTTRLTSLRDDILSQSDSLGDVKTLIDVFRDDLDVLTYRNAYTDSAGNYNYLSRLSSSTSSGQSADKDEVEKARNSIRRIKGVLLSSRSFPASTR